MVQMPKKTASSPPKRWLERIKTFFDVPNRRIARILFISSFATFFSGIAFAFEWTFHGKNHRGFQWIIYYALSLIILPIILWVGLGITMIVTSSHHGSTQVASVAVEEEECVNNNNSSAGKSGNEESKENNCERLAIVVDDMDREKCNGKVLENKTSNSKLKRTVSFPMHSQVRSCRTR
ncbi:PREDICTED: uncharacterized protein LOC109131754 [Camelina sativa]|uniref:Uncharacterized protein LOC109126957 n=1 Tax=Camelina sativa TaxID=90675 RepID=A0ABM1RHI6_CAMSA|nr:PREDICTED: uncharacterized protein LOC109126957 [Camelina sativa]XP_019098474.1 PREDICTED: uncharacterized protein LOC109131754 [Camelina sativa]